VRKALTLLIDAQMRFIEIPVSHPSAALPEVVAEGLSSPNKWLCCRFFYDSLGSQLFERICQLPEYYLTRTERALLERVASEIVQAAGDNLALIEFGSGSSCKTRLLLQAALERQRTLHYTPIDISADFLRASCHSLLSDYGGLTVTALAAEYNDAIAALPDHAGPRLLLFLGSNIGNFTHAEASDFLTRVQKQMQPQDSLLVGVDLLKDRAVIEAAYNDAEGVTAAFNKNLLARINRELDADFDLNAFAHHAPFVEAQSRIEMRLISLRRQVVRVGALKRDFVLERGEIIHTENSHKYSLSRFAALCRSAGLALQAWWLDEREWYGLLLLKACAQAETVPTTGTRE